MSHDLPYLPSVLPVGAFSSTRKHYSRWIYLHYYHFCVERRRKPSTNDPGIKKCEDTKFNRNIKESSHQKLEIIWRQPMVAGTSRRGLCEGASQGLLGLPKGFCH